MILDCLKKSLTDKKGKWPDEFLGCLWAYRTTKGRATGETLFSLAFGSEEIILSQMSSCQVSALYCQALSRNSKEMATSLDLAEEKREQTITCIAAYQQQLISSYNKRAKVRQFQPGDLVLRKAFITARREGSKKMDHIWEGPYKISRVGGKSNYTLATMKRQKDQKAMEHLQSEEVPCVTSRYIKSPKTQAARWAPPHKPRTIQLLCSSYLTAKFSFVSLVFQ